MVTMFPFIAIIALLYLTAVVAFHTMFTLADTIYRT
jgi:hypothetical protein